MIQTIKNAMHALLFQTQLSPPYWVDALNVVVHLLNIIPFGGLESNSLHSVVSKIADL